MDSKKQPTVRATDSKTPKLQRAKAAKEKLENQLVVLADVKAQRAEDQRLARLERRQRKRAANIR